MAGKKRGRTNGGRNGAKKRKTTVARPGYQRTVGYYGRFAPSGGERKFFDTTRATQTVAATGTIMNLSLNLIPQGTTESTRIGRKCVIRALNLRGNYNLPGATAAANTSDILRIIVYVDKQANGATAAVTDILETASYNSFRNLAESGRFKLLYDKSHALNTMGGAGNGTTDSFGEIARPWSFNKRCMIPIEFSSTTGAITEIRSNNIGVLAISKGAVAQLDYIARVRYSDS